MFICQFCGKEYQNKSGATVHAKHCALNPARIPKNNGRTGLHHSAETKLHMKSTHGGGIGSTPEKEKERCRKIRKAMKIKNNGGYKPGSGRGKKGWYKGLYCASSYELAYVIYCLDHNIPIRRNNELRPYMWEGKIRNYIPDFIINIVDVVEIKGYKTKQWEAKLQAHPDIKVLYEKDLQEVFAYVKEKYGKDFIKLYE